MTGPRKASGRSEGPDINRQRADRLALRQTQVHMSDGTVDALIDDNESPLAWLARRKGRDGQPLIKPHQFVAGERLRADFTYASMTPRVTTNWASPMGARGGGNQALDITERRLAAQQRVRGAMDACGPEFSGLIMDVCCFLRGLEDVERERQWPQRTAKIVLQLGLDRLARHYGYLAELRGRESAGIRSWAWPDGGEGAEVRS